MDATARAQRLAARLPRDPANVAPALARTKQGAAILIDHFQCLGDAIASNGGLDDEQRSLLFDVLAVPQVHRNGNRRVPAGSDGPALAALVAKHTARLEKERDTVLSERDQNDREWVKLGIVKYRDTTSRALRSDASHSTSTGLGD